MYLANGDKGTTSGERLGQIIQIYEAVGGPLGGCVGTLYEVIQDPSGFSYMEVLKRQLPYHQAVSATIDICTEVVPEDWQVDEKIKDLIKKMVPKGPKPEFSDEDFQSVDDVKDAETDTIPKPPSKAKDTGITFVPKKKPKPKKQPSVGPQHTPKSTPTIGPAVVPQPEPKPADQGGDFNLAIPLAVLGIALILG